jgi:hypothetical protein
LRLGLGKNSCSRPASNHVQPESGAALLERKNPVVFEQLFQPCDVLSRDEALFAKRPKNGFRGHIFGRHVDIAGRTDSTGCDDGLSAKDVPPYFRLLERARNLAKDFSDVRRRHGSTFV